MKKVGRVDRAVVLAVTSLAAASIVLAQGGPPLNPTQNTNLGIYLFAEHCGTCHDAVKGGAPDRYSLGKHTPEEILTRLAPASANPHVKGMTDVETRLLAVYVGGRPFGADAAGPAAGMMNRCPNQTTNNPFRGSAWNGWGVDPTNSRFQPEPGLSADQVPHLKLKWAFGFPEGKSAYGQPTVMGDNVYVGADTGFVYSLDAGTGCVHWSFRAMAGVRTAISLGRGRVAGSYLAYFGDVKGNVYAVDAQTGAQVWTERADKHPIARITGSPTLAEGRLYVPLASLEESSGGNPKYPCCTFRGGVVAYDAITGKQIWKAYTVKEEPRPLKKTSLGTQLWGPAGAGVWSSPTVDLKRRKVYLSTGNSYTNPAVPGSDAVMSFHLDSGKLDWTKQLLEKDAFVRDCPPPPSARPRSETCPEEMGPDMDFGNAPILRTLPDGRGLIVIGQKNGFFWGLDPDKKGEVVWKERLGPGSLGGPTLQWGSAADNQMAYAPIADARLGAEAGGIVALKLATGERAWRGRPPAPDCDPTKPNCSIAQMAPSTVIPGVVFGGNMRGTIIAFSTADGKVIWQYDTAKEFSTVNGVRANGGTMNGSGAVVAGGMLFVPSGYADLGRGAQGNVLLAFGLE
jgi:polyvinyl alcohol dehydrogenase (cytochrome)